MSCEEFVLWQGFLRRHPRGLRWDNWMQARLAQQFDALLPRKKGARLPRFKDFLWTPPEPLFVAAAEKKAAEEHGLKEPDSE